MAPLPPQSTARVWLDYSDGTNEHSLVARLGDAVSVATAVTNMNAFMLELAPSLNLLTVIGARAAFDGSNVSNPFTWTGAATYGSGTMPVVNAPRELRFIGRSGDGRRVSVSVYGFSGATPPSYRVSAGVDAAVDDAIDALASASAAGVFLSISTAVPVWKTYASFNFNSYWERQARP